ncbi:MAG: leucine-rich repeat-containing protein kinase family protein [Gallionella sp.]|nr:leucine-rich repeat-containing protein kinase family protein [Gallionella sp.]MDP1941678.1 leucine-rich repeat-containing protein kinase family protein [Gallionella sp.]
MDTLTLLRRGQLAGTRRLDLSCGLTQFPGEIYDLADTLEILNLSGNALSSLPDDLGRLHKLRVIFCSDNQFTEVPEVLGQCPQLDMVGFKANRIRHFSAAALPVALRWLILTDNQLDMLPAELGQCIRLQKLMLAGNRLQHLPDEMVACRNLELLRISANRFESLPDWLLELPRLSWLAFAGNPFSDVAELAAVAKQDISHIHWHGLDFRQKLGEGASGIIHRADWQHAPDGVTPVAVKLFKGAVTSDGLPRSEKAACIAAGTHANLIPVTGKVSGHPEGAAGLVMSLIDENYTNLAAPPSLESCTRDIYSADTNFTLDAAIAMARGIAAAAEHLHSRGIMHGDLYAHNMLWNGQEDCLLGDFGAASFITDERQALSLQRIEVRAFACLLEELLSRCTAPSPAAIEALWALQRRCGQDEIEARPLFAEIQNTLAGVSKYYAPAL